MDTKYPPRGMGGVPSLAERDSLRRGKPAVQLVDRVGQILNQLTVRVGQATDTGHLIFERVQLVMQAVRRGRRNTLADPAQVMRRILASHQRPTPRLGVAGQSLRVERNLF